jgi:beta-phosphoglucomutase-like phosphatase (HAD superfamily)
MVEKYTNEKETLYREMCLADRASFRLADGVVEFLDFLKSYNIPMTIATMSEWQNVEFYINEFGLGKWFDLEKIVYSDGKIAGKPSPEIYEIASQRLGLEPKDCIVIEDALSGIESAKGAGIGKIIAIASLESHAFYEKIPYLYQIIDNFDEIDKGLFDVVGSGVSNDVGEVHC